MRQDGEDKCIIVGVIGCRHIFGDFFYLSFGLVVINPNIKLERSEQPCQGVAVHVSAVARITIHPRGSEEVLVVDDDSNSSC